MTGVRMSHAWCDGKFVAAEDLDHGGLMPGHLCLGCGEAVIAKIGTGLQQPHFAHQKEAIHQIGVWRCSQRSLCTRLGGHHARRRIQQALDGEHPLFARWQCRNCRQEHRQNILDGVCAVDAPDTLDGAHIIRLLGPAPPGGQPELQAVLAVGFMREDVIPEEARKMARGAGASLWLLSASSQGSAAQLGEAEQEPLDVVTTFQVPCHRGHNIRPSVPTKPTPAPENLPPEPPPSQKTYQWPKQAKPVTPVPRRQGEPATIPLPTETLDCGNCPSCGKPLVARFLYLHPFPSMSSKDGPVETMGLLLYYTSQWMAVGWEKMTDSEQEIAQFWGAEKMNTMPSTLWNLATLINRDGCDVLGSYSCWCLTCNEVIKTPF